MKKLLLFVASFALSLFPSRVEAQTDFFISSGSVSPYVTLGRGLVWGGQGVGSVGQNFIFHPLNPDQGFCLFVFNNNTTSAHSFTVLVGQTGDPAIQNFSAIPQKWSTVPTAIAFPQSVPANSLIGINYKTTASAGIVISFTGNTTQAGSPDTADIFTVQTSQSSCGTLPVNSVQGPFQQGTSITLQQQFPVLIGGTQQPGATSPMGGYALGTASKGFPLDASSSTLFGGGSLTANNTLATPFGGNAPELALAMPTQALTALGSGLFPGGTKTNLLEMADDLFVVTAFGYSLQASTTNPAAGATIMHHFLKSAATVNLAERWLIISCSAACELKVNRTSSQGTTCTALTVQSLQLGLPGGSRAPNVNEIGEFACTGAPTASWSIMDLNLAAGSVQQIDIAGTNFAKNGTGSGIDVICVGAVTGNVTATLEFAEE